MWLGFLRGQQLRLTAALAAAAVHAAALGAYPLLLDLLVTRLVGGNVNGRLGAWLGAAEVHVSAGPLFVAFGVVVVTKGVAHAAQATWLAEIGFRASDRARRALFEKLLRRPTLEASSGDLMARLLGDVGQVESVVAEIAPKVVADALRAAVLVGLSLVVHPRLSLAALVLVPTVGLPLALFGRQLRSLAVHERAQAGLLVGHMHEMLRGLTLIASFGVEDRERRRFAAASAEQQNYQVRSVRLRALSSPLMEGLGVAVLLAACAWAMSEVDEARLRPGEVVGFILGVVLLYEPLKGLARAPGALMPGWAAERRLRQVLNAPESILEAPGARPAGPLETLRFDNVGFTYAGANKPTLDGLSFEMKAPRLVVIDGPSGVGKTTLLGLVNRLLEPTSGRVLWDEVDVRELTLDSLRARVSVMDQAAHLFSGTGRENLRLASPYADETALMEAWRRARVDLGPGRGVDSPLGEGGLEVSEGQRRRIAFARALLREAPLLWLDEPTASLDAGHAAAVREEIRQEGGRRLVFVATHDPHLIALADEVISLPGGRGSRTT